MENSNNNSKVVFIKERYVLLMYIFLAISIFLNIFIVYTLGDLLFRAGNYDGPVGPSIITHPLLIVFNILFVYMTIIYLIKIDRKDPYLIELTEKWFKFFSIIFFTNNFILNGPYILMFLLFLAIPYIIFLLIYKTFIKQLKNI